MSIQHLNLSRRENALIEGTCLFGKADRILFTTRIILKRVIQLLLFLDSVAFGSGGLGIILLIGTRFFLPLFVVPYCIILLISKYRQRLQLHNLKQSSAIHAQASFPLYLYLRSYDAAKSTILSRLGYIFLSYFIAPAMLAGFLSAGSWTITEWFVPIYTRMIRRDVEEDLADALGNQAAFCAIGDRLASYGAIKLITTDTEWMSDFRLLAERAQLIFLFPGISANALWEVSYIRSNMSVNGKTIWVMPPRTTRAQWEIIKICYTSTVIGSSLPEFVLGGGFFRVKEDGTTTDLIPYRKVIRTLRNASRRRRHAPELESVFAANER
jgi:hypothetical protein